MEYDYELDLIQQWEKDENLDSRATLKIYHQQTSIQNDWVFVDIFSNMNDVDHVEGRKFQLMLTIDETKRLIDTLQKELALFESKPPSAHP